VSGYELDFFTWKWFSAYCNYQALWMCLAGGKVATKCENQQILNSVIFHHSKASYFWKSNFCGFNSLLVSNSEWNWRPITFTDSFIWPPISDLFIPAYFADSYPLQNCKVFIFVLGIHFLVYISMPVIVMYLISVCTKCRHCVRIFESFMMCHTSTRPVATEALKKWDSGRAPRGTDLWGLPLPSYGDPEGRPRKIFENIGAYLCNLMHFWRPVQQKMYNSVFNLHFGRSIWWHRVGRSIWWHRVIKSGTEYRRTEFTIPAI